MGATMATTTAPCSVLGRSRLFLALLICFQILPASQAFKLHGVHDHEEEKVPLAVIVPDPSPELSGSNLPPPPLAAPPPVLGGGGDDMRPKLPTERWRRGRGEVRRSGSAAHPPAAASSSHDARAAPRTAPSASPGPASSRAAAPARAPTVAGAWAPAPGPDSGSGGTAFIESSPAVPVPRGVTDTATILPIPAPGEKQRQEVAAAATSVGAAGLVPVLLLGLIVMMASFGL